MKLSTLAAGCLLAISMVGSARADWDGLGLGYLFGYGGFGARDCNINNRTPPYFAMHPPVYYGQRYTRPYGASPFAAWPQLQPNSAYAPSMHVQRAMIVDNPYVHAGVVESAKPSPIVAAQQPVEPLVIQNPYFQSETDPASAKYTSK